METVFLLAALMLLVFWIFRRSSGHRAPQAPSGASPRSNGAAPLPPIEGPGDPQLDEFLARQLRKRKYYFRATLPSGHEIGVGHTPGEDWVDVAARRWLSGKKGVLYPGPYEAFGYHLRQGRWSFGSDPPYAEEITRILNSYIGARQRPPGP